MRSVAALLIVIALSACQDGDAPAAGIEQERQLWNDTYREPRTFPPSAFLIETVKGLAPGRALDVGMGQGRNALYLASQGWHVTGIDISDEGIRQARAAAAARKLSIDTILQDVSSWDLVLLIYTGDDVAKIRRSLKPGGLLLSERFHVEANPRIGTTPEELAKLYGDGFQILHNDVVTEVSVWGNRHHDPTKVVHFAARKR
jgi:SAM-dependent methyltransferase